MIQEKEGRGRMRKIVLGMVAILFGTAHADEVTAWRSGFLEGADAGYKLCKVEEKQKLKEYEELVDAVFNVKSLMFAGRFPLPTAIQETEIVRKPDGTAEVVRRWKIIPPAYFPLSAIESLKEEWKEGVDRIEKGYAVVLRTSSLSKRELSYAYYSGRKVGVSPVYLPKEELLVFTVKRRKADAEDVKKKLLSFGVKAEVTLLKEPIKVDRVEEDTVSLLRLLGRKLQEKEEKLLGIKSKVDSIDYLISVLDRALVTAKALEDNPNYKELDLVAVERDIEAVKDNLLAYLYDREPYKRVVLFDPYEEERKGYEEKIRKLREENEKLRKEVERLKLLVGKKEELNTDSKIIKKYLRGEL
jgi:hypothetical protein